MSEIQVLEPDLSVFHLNVEKWVGQFAVPGGRHLRSTLHPDSTTAIRSQWGWFRLSLIPSNQQVGQVHELL